ncbi:DNA (cytosine-5-)-methyltransferase [Sphaerisporangium sp. NBC_01403]|uniref:DNA cytosine methyltransferase n=1 Tax=Sphaerisporangium sp. NBC_01403 TaxID=2903599 RepID=UPI003250FC02
MTLEVIEICAGAGGQALGLHLAGFTHRLAFELDPHACNTLRENALQGRVAVTDPEKAKDGTWVVSGDVADPDNWKPTEFRGVDLLAGGVPCPPFTIAGKQLGATDERDLFAWAVEQVNLVQPRALLLENVRGMSMPRFAGYRQHVMDRLREFGYAAEWRLLNASEYGIPQLRPRFVLIAMKPDDFAYFHWPEKSEKPAPTVGETLLELMKANGWKGAEEWAAKADAIAPTIVGGSKKHGGADLGPTRAKRAWAELGVDAYGVHDMAPPYPPKRPMTAFGPKLTCEMVALLQGWDDGEFKWTFTGPKTARYRQIGNAFPPPIAKALGVAIASALNRETEKHDVDPDPEHDFVYRALRDTGEFMTAAQIVRHVGLEIDDPEIDKRISLLSRDFELLKEEKSTGMLAYKLGGFKAFVGQRDHVRHEYLRDSISKIS